MTLKEAIKLMDEMEKVLERTDPLPESLWSKYHTLVRSIIEGILPKVNNRGFSIVTENLIKYTWI